MWALFVMLPVGLVPFTYVLSFFFAKEIVAQTVIIFVNLIFAGIGSLVVTLLRFFESTLEAGDLMSSLFKVLPNFCLTEGIYILSEHSNMYNLRNKTDFPISEDIWATDNIGGNVLALGIHFFAGIFLLFVLEGFLIDLLSSCISKIRTRQVPRIPADEVDSDVEAEDKRVGEAKDLSVKVHKFRKVYTTLFGKPFTAV